MERKAIVIKMGGNKEMGNAMALAALAPELMELRSENDKLHKELDEVRRKKYKENALKMAEYAAYGYDPDPLWVLVLASVWDKLCAFARLFVEKDECENDG